MIIIWHAASGEDLRYKIWPKINSIFSLNMYQGYSYGNPKFWAMYEIVEHAEFNFYMPF